MTESTPYRQQRETKDRRFLRIGSEVLGVGLVVFNCFATQYAAAEMHYASFLSGRMIAHLYQPFAWWWWQHYWPHNALRIGNRVIFLAPMWKVCEHLVIYPLLVLGVVGGLIGVLLNQRQAPADLHGSASWADAAEIKKASLL
jgi:hypothetical protein